MKEAILIIEDDNDISQMLKDLLEQHGYQAAQAYSGTEALLLLKERVPEAVILDLMLPGMAGEEVLKEIKEQYPQVGVIVSSAKDSVNTRISLLRAGADDYMVKPFDTEELLARLEAVLRRRGGYEEAAIPAPGGTGNVWAAGSEPVKSRRNVRGREGAVPEEPGGESAKDAARVLAYKDIRIWQDDFLVLVSGQEVAFTKHEYLILELLMSNPKKVFTKANIYASVWNQEFLGEDNAVNVHISNLRQKLAKAHPEETYIQTVWGIGFKMG